MGDNKNNKILTGIFIMLVGVFVLLLIIILRKPDSDKDVSANIQQDVIDYANKQRQNEPASASKADAKAVGDDNEPDGIKNKSDDISVSGNEQGGIAGDEDDISYTKEFILSEMLPYFEANDLDAVWDLAHLKRYIRLSKELEGSGTYYYKGDVNDKGLPDGKGLAIYENNTYYYGGWADGKREGTGRWHRFYINASDKITQDQKYLSHSYAGGWKNDLPNGEGAEHYDVDITKLEPYERIIQNVVGNFTDGLYDDYMYANTVDYVGLVEEWYGIARQGVFESWEDISSLGEYFAWQGSDDKTKYMKIAKKDNKDQGMREVLSYKN